MIRNVDAVNFAGQASGVRQKTWKIMPSKFDA
jgi:hypothetical protein